MAVSTSHLMLDRRVTSIGLGTPTVDVVLIQRSRPFTRDLSPVGRTDNFLGLLGLRTGQNQQSAQRTASRQLSRILTVLGHIYLGYKYLFLYSPSYAITRTVDGKGGAGRDIVNP